MIQVIDIADFSGGLNTRDGAGGVADNEYVEALNVYLVAKGIAKRKGFSRYMGSTRIDTVNAGTSITDAQFVTNGQKIVCTAGSKIATKGTSTWTDITNTVTITADYPIITCMINDNLVGVNGVNPAFYYTGSGNAITLSGDNIPTSPKVCESYAGRLFLGNGNTLYWGGYMGKWQDFHPDNNQPFSSKIQGLKVYGDSTNSYMLVLCDRHVYIAQFAPETVQTGGLGQFTFDQISAQHGCAAPASVEECYIPGLGFCILWVDYDGVKIFNPSIGVQKVTDKIRDDWEALNLSNISKFTGKFYKTKGWYILSCSSSTSTTLDMQIVIDLYNSNPIQGKYVIASIFDLDLATVGTVMTSGIEYLVGCDSTGYWNRYDNEQSDNTVAIDGYFKTKTFGEPYYNKGFQSITFAYAYMGVNTGIDLTLFLDNTTENYYATHNIVLPTGAALGSFVLDQDTLLIGSGMGISGEEVKGWGRTIQVKVRNNEVDKPFRMHRLMVNYKPGRMVLTK
jgi:hypothetical protein